MNLSLLRTFFTA